MTRPLLALVAALQTDGGGGADPVFGTQPINGSTVRCFGPVSTLPPGFSLSASRVNF